MNSGKLFLLAWRVIPRLPDAVVRGIFCAAAVIAHALRIPAVRQLELNLSRVVPERSSASLRRLTRAGMRSYMRYYGEAFQLPGLSQSQIAARVRAVGIEPLLADLAAGRPAVGALTHSGNWDLAGAWFAQQHGRLLTVAETLEPEELFQQFLSFRRNLGMQIVPFARGAGVFGTLLKQLRPPVPFVPLLADRDLSREGVDVAALGTRMRVAAGPAALAIAGKAALYSVHIRYERLYGDRRKRAGSPWGIVITFSAPIAAVPGPSQAAVSTMTQAWVDDQMLHIRATPQDWHMLQKVFIADLDPDRLASARDRS
ncbi:MAG: phosphatidylinositol mannoside acyltransferase [Beutenbergiaceae bacterium]